MPRSPRAPLACLAFASGASALAWIQPTLGWITLSPTTGGGTARLGIASVLLGFFLGAFAGRRAAVHTPTPTRVGRAQLALAVGCAGLTLLLPHSGVAAPFLLLLVGVPLGAAAQAVWGELDIFLLGAATGFGFGGALRLAGVGIPPTCWAAVAAMAITAGWALRFPAGAFAPAAAPGGDDQARAPLCGLAIGAALAFSVMLASRALAPYTGDSVYARAALGSVTLCGIAIGTSVGRARRKVSRLLVVAAIAAGIASVALYGDLEWILPGAVSRLGGLASWPRALTLTAAEASFFLLPAAVALAALVGKRASAALPWLALGASGAALFGAPVTAWISEFAIGRAPFEQRYGPLLYFDESDGLPVLVTDDPEQGRILRHGDGRSLGGVGTDPEDRVNAQIPMLSHPAPRRVLQIGFGVGNGASSLLSHPIERLDVVDPTGVAAEIAPFFDETNLDVLSDDRLTVHSTDPWRLLRRTDETWDVIRLPVTHLENADGADLPTIERLSLLERRLTPGGIVSLRLNIGRASLDEIRSVVRTMKEVFEQVTIWDGPLGYTWVINGSGVTRLPNLPAVDARREDPDLDAEFGSLGLDDPLTLRGHFVMGDDDASHFAGDAPVVTTSRAVIDASAARSPDTFYGLGGAVADTPLADLTSEDGRANVGLARLFEKLHQTRAFKRPARAETRNEP